MPGSERRVTSKANNNAEVIIRTAGWLAYLSKQQCREAGQCHKASKFEVWRKGVSTKKFYPCKDHLSTVVDNLLRGEGTEDVEE